MTLKKKTLPEVHDQVRRMVERHCNRLQVLDYIAKHDGRSGLGLSVDDMHGIYAAHVPMAVPKQSPQ